MNPAAITNTSEMKTQLEAILAGIVPEIELGYKAELAAEINRLKREKNAVILGHNYIEPALVNSIPAFVCNNDSRPPLFNAIAVFAGDARDLRPQPAATDAAIFFFCGVRFMAETAK